MWDEDGRPARQQINHAAWPGGRPHVTPQPAARVPQQRTSSPWEAARQGDRDDEQPPPRRLDRSPWHWLLLIPIVVPLYTPLYNRIEPSWFGLPFFYWCQLAFAFLAALIISVVHVATKEPSSGSRDW